MSPQQSLRKDVMAVNETISKRPLRRRPEGRHGVRAPTRKKKKVTTDAGENMGKREAWDTVQKDANESHHYGSAYHF